jgi:hypothetical protein
MAVDQVIGFGLATVGLGGSRPQSVPHDLLGITPAARRTTPIGVRMGPPRAPTTVGTFARNAVAPVPIAPMIPPVVAMPTVSAA